jgi:hypothetical protein
MPYMRCVVPDVSFNRQQLKMLSLQRRPTLYTEEHKVRTLYALHSLDHPRHDYQLAESVTFKPESKYPVCWLVTVCRSTKGCGPHAIASILPVESHCIAAICRVQQRQLLESQILYFRVSPQGVHCRLELKETAPAVRWRPPVLHRGREERLYAARRQSPDVALMASNLLSVAGPWRHPRLNITFSATKLSTSLTREVRSGTRRS